MQYTCVDKRALLDMLLPAGGFEGSISTLEVLPESVRCTRGCGSSCSITGVVTPTLHVYCETEVVPVGGIKQIGSTECGGMRLLRTDQAHQALSDPVTYAGALLFHLSICKQFPSKAVACPPPVMYVMGCMRVLHITYHLALSTSSSKVASIGELCLVCLIAVSTQLPWCCHTFICCLCVCLLVGLLCFLHCCVRIARVSRYGNARAVLL